MTAPTAWRPDQCPNYLTLVRLMEKFLPGKSAAICGLREDCASACANPLVNDILILGGVGSGKTFLAKLIALGKEFVGIDPDVAEHLVEMGAEKVEVKEVKLAPRAAAFRSKCVCLNRRASARCSSLT